MVKIKQTSSTKDFTIGGKCTISKSVLQGREGGKEVVGLACQANVLILEVWYQHKPCLSSVPPIQIFQVPPTDLLSITLEVETNSH